MRLFAVLAWLLAFAAQPAAAASSPELVSLEQQLASLIAGKSGEYGIAALDLRTGKTVSINGDVAFPMASTVKVAVAAAYLTQVDHGRRTLDQTISGRSATSLLEAMLVRSDNVATDMLIRNLGGPKTVQQWIDWHGLPGISVDRTIAELLSDPRDLRDRRDSSTPIAMIGLLKKIEMGNVLSPGSRSFLKTMMARCITGSNRMRALLPAGTPIEHKTGTLTGLTDDVGYITLPDGRRIAVAIFARYGSDRPRTIAEAARAIYDGFTAPFLYPYNAAFGAR